MPAGLLPASVQLPESDSSPGQRQPPQAVQAPEAHSGRAGTLRSPKACLPAPLALPGHCPTSPSTPLSLTPCSSPHPSPPQRCSACWCSVRPRSWPTSHREQLLVAHPNLQAANSQEHAVVCKLRKGRREVPGWKTAVSRKHAALKANQQRLRSPALPHRHHLPASAREEPPPHHRCPSKCHCGALTGTCRGSGGWLEAGQPLMAPKSRRDVSAHAGLALMDGWQVQVQEGLSPSGRGESSGVSSPSFKDINPTPMTSSRPNYHLQVPSHWGVGLQPRNLEVTQVSP